MQVARFQGKVLRNPPNRHTANDKEGWIGDIQIDNADGSPFEGVEVKSGIKITPELVSVLHDKFRGQAVSRYYILSTENPYIVAGRESSVDAAVNDIRERTGCQVIANGLMRSLWYYLRLIEDPEEFLRHYTEQLDSDRDVAQEHVDTWHAALQEFTDNRLES
ncbi:MAG: hypothetical protein NTZ05_07415 [Chloroflexi bacterium]|nr:hypothetical protein [Chloroflexota bacterium]